MDSEGTSVLKAVNMDKGHGGVAELHTKPTLTIKKVSGVHSEAQIMRLSLEFRRLKKELHFVKSSFNCAKTEHGKVVELLKDEDIPFRGQLLGERQLKESNKEEEIDLLLTNGEIDLDKVLCLHVFSISQPYVCKKGKQEGPNMRINQLIRYSEYLPCYLVDHIDSTINCTCWERAGTTFDSSDRSMTLHLQVNSQIEKMMYTVTNVLKNLNPSKLKKLSLRAQSVEEIQCTLEKPENQAFISSLLHAQFIKEKGRMRIEMCTVMQGKTHLIHDIGKFKKNLVFRLDVPESLSEIYYGTITRRGGPTKPLPAKDLAESSFEQLLQIKKHVGSNVSIIPGYQLLQKGSSTGGIAVIDQTGTSISYLAGKKTPGKKKNTTNDITIIMQSPKTTDHEYVMEKMSEMNGDKIIILARPRNKVEEVSLRVARRNMKTSKKIAQDDTNHEKTKEELLKRLSNEERIAIAHKAAMMKNSVVNSKGKSQSIPMVELLKGTVEQHSLLKLVRYSTDAEREVLFKPAQQGGMGIGELLMDKQDLNIMSRLEGWQQAENAALVEKACNYRAPQKLDVGIDSQFGIVKIEHEVSKREILKSCKVFERRLQKKKKVLIS